MATIDKIRGIPSTPSGQDCRRAQRWRREQLIAAGFDELSARRLAAVPDLDLHAVLICSDTCTGECLPGPGTVAEWAERHG